MTQDEMKDLLEAYLLTARQQIAPSHVLLEMKRDLKEVKETLDKVLVQAEKTNGRVLALENWKSSFGAFISGGKSVWLFIASAIGIAWVVFGETLRTKLGLK